MCEKITVIIIIIIPCFFMTYLFTYSMEQSPSSEVNWF